MADLKVIMPDLKELKDFTEIEFVQTALEAISQVFAIGEKKYLGKTRLMKLVAFTADTLDFPLTRGWFRFGYYAPEPNKQISNLLESYQTFERFPHFQIKCEKNTLKAFKKAVLSLNHISYLKKLNLINGSMRKWLQNPIRIITNMKRFSLIN
jgi:hypothetical protein